MMASQLLMLLLLLFKCCFTSTETVGLLGTGAQDGHLHFYTAPELCPYNIVQELCESRGGRPGLSVLTSLLVSVDVKSY